MSPWRIESVASGSASTPKILATIHEFALHQLQISADVTDRQVLQIRKGKASQAWKIKAATFQGEEMKLYTSERTVLLIDGANLHATAKSLGFDIDYRRLLQLFQSKVRLVRAIYYTAVTEEPEYSSIRPLIDWLDYNGFSVVTKPVKEFADFFGKKRFKGNMDVELTVDAMRMANSLDHVMIFSGDGDLRSLVAALQELGKRVSVISTVKTDPPMIADELRRQADHFIDLADLEREINRVYPDAPRQGNGRTRRSTARDDDLADLDDDEKWSR